MPVDRAHGAGRRGDAHQQSSGLYQFGGRPMTEDQKDIAVVLIAVASGRVSATQLRQYLKLKTEEVNAIGAKRGPMKTLRRLAAIESALERIKIEERKYHN